MCFKKDSAPDENLIRALTDGAGLYISFHYEAPGSGWRNGDRYSRAVLPDLDEKEAERYDPALVRRTMDASPSRSASQVLSELDRATNPTFTQKLLSHIDRRHLKDSSVYKAACVDRRLFSKIVSDREYKPSKDTCLSFVFALRLNLNEALDLLQSAGYTLSHSDKRDVIIEYLLRQKTYDLITVNEVLFRMEQKIIGR